MQQELLRNLSAIPGHVIACLVQLAWNSASPASVLRLVAALSHPSVRDATLSSTLVRAIKTLKHRMNWRYPKQQVFLGTTLARLPGILLTLPTAASASPTSTLLALTSASVST